MVRCLCTRVRRQKGKTLGLNIPARPESGERRSSRQRLEEQLWQRTHPIWLQCPCSPSCCFFRVKLMPSSSQGGHRLFLVVWPLPVLVIVGLLASSSAEPPRK